MRLARPALVLGFVASVLFATADARAVIKQPDGTIIPTPPGLLTDVFKAAGDPTIDVVAAAQVTPETFKPACSIKFNLISRGGAAFKNIFGWYNSTGSKPPISDLHVLLDCADPPKSVVTAIRKDPAYKGGNIGFFLITPENGGFGMCPSLPTDIGSVGGGSKNAIYYSEASLNPDSSTSSKHVHLLIYDSVAFKPAFYFAWEDLYAGGDNEFTDFVARVDNIVCAAAGEPCDTGKLGICKFGVKSCVDGKVVCTDGVKPSSKKCNGLDNDCDGVLDDGPCPDGTICTKGACIPKCDTGEFKCTGGLVCDGGVCVEPPCVGKTCPDGKTCVKGDCVDACTGVTCPFGKICRIGVCVDPCDGISCGTDEVCELGLCIPACTCAGCADSTKACDTTSKHCVPGACVGKTCPAGSHCIADGSCADDCASAVCPKGETCTAGKCVPVIGGDAGPEVGPDFDSGVGDVSFGDDVSFETGTIGDNPQGESKGTCHCRAAGDRSDARFAAPLALAIAAIFVRRRRRA